MPKTKITIKREDLQNAMNKFQTSHVYNLPDTFEIEAEISENIEQLPEKIEEITFKDINQKDESSYDGLIRTIYVLGLKINELTRAVNAHSELLKNLTSRNEKGGHPDLCQCGMCNPPGNVAEKKITDHKFDGECASDACLKNHKECHYEENDIECLKLREDHEK